MGLEYQNPKNMMEAVVLLSFPPSPLKTGGGGWWAADAGTETWVQQLWAGADQIWWPG